MTLNDILQNAQGGKAVAKLAERYGLTPEQARGRDAGDDPGLLPALERLKSPSRRAWRARSPRSPAAATRRPTPRPSRGRRRGAGAAASVFGSPEAVREVARACGRGVRRRARDGRRRCCRRSPRSCSAASPMRWRARACRACSAISPPPPPRPAGSAPRSACGRAGGGFMRHARARSSAGRISRPIRKRPRSSAG